MRQFTRAIQFLLVTLMLVGSNLVFSQHHEASHDHSGSHGNVQSGGAIDTKEEINAYIKHHLKDSHDFTLYSYDGADGQRHHLGFSLPVIVKTSKGFTAFMSSEFHHNDDGHIEVNKNGARLVQIHSKIYEVDSSARHIEFDEHHHPTNAHAVLDLSITKSVFGMLLVGLLLILAFGSLAKGYKKGPIPTGFARVLEPLVLFVRDEIALPNIGEKKYRKYMGFLLTVFFFIWVSNLIGLVPLGFNITGQIAVTTCLALFTFFITQFTANKDYWKHIFWMPGVPKLMRLILAPIEVLGMFTKPFSLLVRLFANITAGHSVVMGITALMIILKAKFGAAGATGISLFLTLFLTLIELLVAFLQAYIFTMLSSLFIGMAVEDHDHH